MKKVLISVTNDLSYDQRMHRIADAFCSQGYEVLLIGRKRKRSIPLPDKAFRMKRLECLFEKGKLFYLEFNIRLLLFALVNRFDVYYAVDLDTLLPMTISSKINKARLYYDAHEYFTQVPELVNRPVVQSIWHFIGKICIPVADTALTVGPALSKALENEYGRAFHVVRNVPVKREKITNWPVFLPIEKQAFLLYQGALNEGRGLEVLIETMQDINYPLLIAGEGDLSELLRDKVKALGLERKVYFLGFLEPEKLWQVTCHAFIGFNLLENKGKSYYYSLANKFFDYIAAGVPTISMDFPEYRSVNQVFEVAYLLKDINREKISIAIGNFASNKVYYSMLQNNCRQASAKYNWSVEEQYFLSLLHER